MDDESATRTADRTCRVPLKIPGPRQWTELRRFAHQSANYGNHLLTELYAGAKGLRDLHSYTDYRDILSSAVRDAVNRDCAGVWRRWGKNILSGEQTLARFSADRALAVRDRGATLARADNGALFLSLRLHPRSKGPATILRVWMPAVRRDQWLADLLGKIERREYPLTRLILAFKRPGRGIVALISYRKPIVEDAPGRHEATLWCSSGECRLLSQERSYSLNDSVHRLAAMKLHFTSIHARLRRDLGKRGRRRVLRQALLRAGSFERWAEGPLHQMSREIIDWCREQQVGSLRWTVEGPAGELPWSRLAALVRYKGEEAGIRLVAAAATDEADMDSRRKARRRTRAQAAPAHHADHGM
jgi:hypothetical protein